jgi:hypothetical protein
MQCIPVLKQVVHIVTSVLLRVILDSEFALLHSGNSVHLYSEMPGSNLAQGTDGLTEISCGFLHFPQTNT